MASRGGELRVDGIRRGSVAGLELKLKHSKARGTPFLVPFQSTLSDSALFRNNRTTLVSLVRGSDGVHMFSRVNFTPIVLHEPHGAPRETMRQFGPSEVLRAK